MRKMTGQNITGSLALGCMLFGGISAKAVTYDWTNADGDNNYLTTNNWAYLGGDVATNLPSVNGDVVNVNLNGADRLILTASTPGNIDIIDVGNAAGANGEIEQNGGLAKATANSSKYSRIGNAAGATGLWTVNDGTAELNRCDIGGSGGVGTVVVNGGVFKVSRGGSGYSLRLDITGDGGLSQGNFEISGGVLSTRVGLLINDYGTFTVKGGASSVLIGGAGEGQCVVDVKSGGTLAVQVAADGLSPIEIDNDHVTDASYTTFDAGSLLEPSFLGGHMETNAWVVMALEHSDVAGTGITDNGLALAVGVDPLWDFGVASDPVLGADVLWVGYAGAEYELLPQPPAGTNRYVNAVIAMPETWNLFAPEGGDTALSNESSSGFIATIDTVVESDYRPAVAQEFLSDRDISQVGQSVTVNFDIELLDGTGNLDSDFRFALYDTNTNYQMTMGMLDLGTPSGTSMRMRFDPEVSSTAAFVPGDYSHLCGGGGTLISASGGTTIGLANGVNHIEASVTRTATNVLEVVTIWTDSGSNTLTCSLTFDELTNPDDVPPGGKWNQLNGFGIKLYDNSPFTAGVGSYEVSNFELSYSVSLADGFGYNVSDITVEPSGDVILTLTDPVVGAVYNVLAASNLTFDTPVEIGSYVSEAPGIITIPAADAAPYTPTAFFDVELPVVEVPYD